MPTVPAAQLESHVGELIYAGAAAAQQGKPEEAEIHWRRALALDAGCVAALICLTDMMIAAERKAEAALCLDKLIAASEKTAPTLVTLANKSLVVGRLDQARTLLNEALLAASADSVRSHAELLLAMADFSENRWEAAIERASRILEGQPNHLEALKIRQKSWEFLAYAEQDEADCRLLVTLRPNALEHSDLIFKCNFLADCTPESIYNESRRWNALYAEPLKSRMVSHSNTRDPERRLKIGYVSPDFRSHAIMKVLPSVFENHDGSAYEIFAYSINMQRQDAVTEYVRRTVKNFAELPSDTQMVAERVRADGIDILVDLAGHTMPIEALLAFAEKPAPVQVTWLGVHLTTGMDAMDYSLGDGHLPAPGTEHLFSENIYRLQRALYCYRPESDPGLAPSPYFANGYITFGCLNNPKKVTREMAQVWSVILHLHPDSRLLLRYVGLERAMVQQRLRQWFLADGIAEERLQFEGSSNSLDYMASWNRVDIDLDPYPYNGGTTTLDALWMGVPVVSVCGRLAVSCCGASFLSALGLPVASSFEEYIALASEVVKLVIRTHQLRVRVRQAMLGSELMDEKGFVKALERAYRNMWRQWCQTHAAT